MRRVVVTGMGLLTPLGCGVNAVWDRIISGKSGITEVKQSPLNDFLKSKVYAYLPFAEDGDEHGFSKEKYKITSKLSRTSDMFLIVASAASREAMDDANIADYDGKIRDEIKNQINFDKFGVNIGSGIGSLISIEDQIMEIENRLDIVAKDPEAITRASGGVSKRFSPFMIPKSLINMPSGSVSIHYGLKGPNHSVVTACSTGGHAITDAARFIRTGEADAMVTGSAEYLDGAKQALVGFDAMGALSSKFNDDPTKASRPWDKDRDGFVIGNGSGIMVLEDLEVAKKRGAEIYAEIAGYGLSGDAYNITAPSGDGAVMAMKFALENANLKPSDIDYINAHGTSTPLGDLGEARAVNRVFGSLTSEGQIPISSTKSAIGHLLGAAGSVEGIFSVLAIRDGIIPPTLNLDNVEDELKSMNLVPHVAQKKDVKYVMSNSFGFGGTNISVIFKKYED